MKAISLAALTLFSLAVAACASTAQDVRATTASRACSPPGPAVVNADSRLFGFVTTDKDQPLVVTPGTLELQGRGVQPSTNGVAAHTAANTSSGRGNTTCL